MKSGVNLKLLAILGGDLNTGDFLVIPAKVVQKLHIEGKTTALAITLAVMFRLCGKGSRSCYAFTKSIAAMASKSERSVRRDIVALRSIGLLSDGPHGKRKSATHVISQVAYDAFRGAGKNGGFLRVPCVVLPVLPVREAFVMGFVIDRIQASDDSLLSTNSKVIAKRTWERPTRIRGLLLSLNKKVGWELFQILPGREVTIQPGQIVALKIDHNRQGKGKP